MDGWDHDVTRLVAGFAGALCYGIIRPNPKWTRWIGNGVVGVAVSFFCGPVLCDWQGWSNVHASNAVAAGLGFVGVIGLRSCAEVAESDGTKTLIFYLKNWLKRTFGVPPSNGDYKPPDSWTRENKP